MPALKCANCSHVTETERLDPTCERCDGPVLLENAGTAGTSRSELEGLPAGVWRFRKFLPYVNEAQMVSLGEGGTPLLTADRLGAELGLPNLIIKDESRNPTGSFMDRGSTVLLSLAKRDGVTECWCTTTGNLGASLAAYCARADISARISVHPNADQSKLYQMLAYGADLEHPVPTQPSARSKDNILRVTAGNPYILEGEKTTGFEMVQELGWKAPDVVVVPMGTGGHLLMIWRSVLELDRAGLLGGKKCRLLGVQLGGHGRGHGTTDGPGSQLAELEGSVPYFRELASQAVADSKGLILRTTPEHTYAATGTLAKSEGIFAEPSSASVVAVLSSALKSGDVRKDETIACVITSAGLKDPRAFSRIARAARRIPLADSYARPSAQIGETKFEILRLMERQPSYGYQLRRDLTKRRMISTASVYQHLLELERFGMVRRRSSTVVRGRERVTYELTAKGSDYLKIAGELQRSSL